VSRQKTALVTGGAGFVGRHLVGALLKLGDEVHCVDPVAPLTGGILPDKWPLFLPADFRNFHFHASQAIFLRQKSDLSSGINVHKPLLNPHHIYHPTITGIFPLLHFFHNI